MDPTVAFVWSRSRPPQSLPIPAPSPSEWAVSLLESGFDSEAIRWLTDPDPPLGMQDRLIGQILRDIGRDNLLDIEQLKDALESESIADYFEGKIDGWTLINRGCWLYNDDYARNDERSHREFWIRVAEDAGEHGGQGLCAEFPFSGGEFDEVLKTAIRQSNRPLPAGVAHISRKQPRRER